MIMRELEGEVTELVGRFREESYSLLEAGIELALVGG